MSTNYGYGNYSNYGYGTVPGNYQTTPTTQQQSAVGYGGSNMMGGAYTYYSQQATPTTQQSQQASVGYGNTYNNYQVSQSMATPTNSTSSVAYPNYYTFTKNPSQVYGMGVASSNSQPTYPLYGNTSYYMAGGVTYPSTTIASYTGGVAYPSTTSSYTGSVAYPQTSSAYYTPTTMYQSYDTTQSSYTSNTTSNTTSLTPQQEQVIRNYATAKSYNKGKHFLKKKSAESQQEYYCEVCKVGCGSALTYKTHVDGKNHKKRLQQLARVVANPPSDSQIKCDVCDIFCSNRESYLAHIKGSKHLKTVGLFRRLGKPLPTMTSVVQQDNGSVQVTGPRITFVGGKKLSSTGLTLEPFKKDAPQIYPPGAPTPAPDSTPSTMEEENPNVEPIGENFIKTVKGDPRSPLSSYYCELCECFFNDDMARLVHCKGRRHRLNYKKKIDPTLKVDQPKSVIKAMQKKKEMRRGTRGKGRTVQRPHPSGPISMGGVPRRGGARGARGANIDVLRREEALALASLQREKQTGGYRSQRRVRLPRRPFDDHWGPPPPLMRDELGWDSRGPLHPPIIKNPADDKLVSSKYGQLYPNEIEMKIVHKTIQSIESALKAISDDILLEACKHNAVEQGNLTVEDSAIEKDESLREVKGVMKVGLYAHNLLLTGHMNVQLVVMCSNVPTRTLLLEMIDSLPTKLHASNTDMTFHVTGDPKQSKLLVMTTSEDITVTVDIVLTSHAIKESSNEESTSTSSALDKQSCLAGLNLLQQTKWFQAMCQGLPSFSFAMRILLDLCLRNPVWSVLNEWVLQILIHKCIVSANPDYVRPGDIIRRVIECIASGVLLPGYPGLLDPCDDGGGDVIASLTAQERADLTLSAQHYLRLIAFNQLHLIINIDPPTDYAPYCMKSSFMQQEDEEVEEEVKEEVEENESLLIPGAELKHFKLDDRDI